MKKQRKISLNTGKRIDSMTVRLTPFQKKVLSAACEIGFGQIKSYSWLAKRAGLIGAQRAIGQALKNNPFLLLIPCHRVIKTNGKINGYVLGSNLKRRLLSFEKDIGTSRTLRP